MESLVNGAISQHVRKLVGLDQRKEKENVTTLLLPQVERIVLVQEKKLKNVIPTLVPVKISNIRIFWDKLVTVL